MARRLVIGSLIASVAFVNACGMYYTPKPSISRPPSVAVANTPDAQACSRTCQQTHEISRGNCHQSYTQYNGHEVQREVQGCVDRVDDARDSCLMTCPGVSVDGPSHDPADNIGSR